MVGKTISHYKILEKTAAGQIGTVFGAYDKGRTTWQRMSTK